MFEVLDFIARIVVIIVGIIIILGTITSAIRSFVLARSARDSMTGFVFRAVRWFFNMRLKKAQTYEDRDRIMAMYAPVSLFMVPLALLVFLTVGYTLIFWALGAEDINRALTLSGSSLLTLGFDTTRDIGRILIEFSEAAIGLVIIALLIAYLPTMYSAFSRRESTVTMLEVRAGDPPSAVEMLERAYRIRGLQRMDELWIEWERWFADIEESHTSLPALIFFRSVKPHRSWVTAAGAVLDAAALYQSTLDVPRSSDAALCIRAGYLALRYIMDFFGLPYNGNPNPDDPISISKEEFIEVYNQLKESGVPLKPDIEQCWEDFAGWRVNYDVPLITLAALTLAPYAPWSSDRSIPGLNEIMNQFEG